MYGEYIYVPSKRIVIQAQIAAKLMLYCITLLLLFFIIFFSLVYNDIL